MTRTDREKKADELARAAWPEARLGLSEKHLAVAGLNATEYMPGLYIITSRTNRDQYFRGSLDAAMLWLAVQPPAQPPKHVDPRADLRASVNEKLASLAADAATIWKKDRAR